MLFLRHRFVLHKLSFETLKNTVKCAIIIYSKMLLHTGIKKKDPRKGLLNHTL